MSKDTVFTIFDELRKRAVGINDKSLTRPGFVFSLLPVGYPLNAEDFSNPWSPSAAMQAVGDAAATATAAAKMAKQQNSLFNLSQFVDLKLSMDGTGSVVPGSTHISDTWKLILDAATPSPDRPEPNPIAVKRVKEAEEYLRRAKADDPDVLEDSVAYKAYKVYKTAYEEASLAYTAAYQDAMKNPDGIAVWPVKGKIFLSRLDTAYNDWIGLGNKEKVEGCLNTIAAQGKDAIEAVIANAKKAFEPWQLTLGVVADTTPYVQVFPSDWAEPVRGQNGWNTFGFEQKDVRTEHSDESTSWGARSGISFGFWSFGGAGGNEERRIHDEFTSDELAIEMTYGVVSIARPWLSTILLNVKGWVLHGQDKGVISDGRAQQKDAPSDEAFWLPSLPTQMVIAKNIKIRTKNIQNTYDYLEQHTMGGGGFGWGPFSFGGSYRRDSYSSTSRSHFEEGWLVIDGAQLIGWISQVMPQSPYESGL